MRAEISISTAPIESLHSPLLAESGVTLKVLRLDKIHPSLGGNKYFKLKYNLREFQQRPELPILSFGGAYSNHLHALAAAGKLLGMQTIGVVRGELPATLNPVLRFASQQGMVLHPISRSDYRHKREPAVLQALRREYGDFHLLPEGGSNQLALRGCEEIAALLQWSEDAPRRLLALCCGTGTTMAGLIGGLSRHLPNAPEVLGVSVLKADGYLQAEVAEQLTRYGRGQGIAWRVEDRYHCGGYARSNAALASFLEQFRRCHEMPIEPVYTGKLFYALFDLIQRGEIQAGTELIAIHSGGVHK